MQTLTLKSNSLTADDNHAGVFKINYNNQLDFTGRKVALINASLTKAQANVSNEKITISQEKPQPGPGPKIVDEFKMQAPWINHLQYLNRFKKNIVNGTKLLFTMDMNFDATTKVVTLQAENKTDFNAYLVFKSYPGPDSCWKVISAKSSQHMQRTNTRPQQVDVPAANGIPAHKEYTITLLADHTSTVKVSMLGMDLMKISDLEALKLLPTKPYLRVEYIPTVNTMVQELHYIQPGPGHFPSIESLMDKVNKLLTKFGKFSYVNGRVLFAAKTTGPSFKLNFGGLRVHFGFDELELVYTKGSISKFLAARPPDLTRGTLHFHVYCSLIQDVYVNEQKRPLIASLDATKSEYGKQHIFNVVTPIYLNCVEGPQAFIEVTIANDSGSIDGLLMGETQLVFAFSD
jgi:hypothetical protein